jgi:hypothetical protein
MKKEINRISNIFRTEMKLLSVLISSIRRHIAASIFLLTLVLIAGRGITEAHLSVPFLRGGYTATKPLRPNMSPLEIMYGLSSLKKKLAHIGDKIRFQIKQTEDTEYLDDVLGAFRTVLSGNDIDTAQLLKACKAHLKLMKTGGASLRLVAKDLESNLLKAEKPFKKSPKQGKTLYSLLESERYSGIHHGNELENDSAAMVCASIGLELR